MSTQRADRVAPCIDGLARTLWAALRQKTLRVTWQQQVVLRALSMKGPARVGEIAEQLRVTRSTASIVVHQLAAQDLVQLQKPPSDARGVEVHLSPRGTQVLEVHRLAMKSLLELALEDWSEHDIEQLARLTTRLDQSLAAVLARSEVPTSHDPSSHQGSER